MVYCQPKSVFFPLLCLNFVAFARAKYDESIDWDIQDPDLTKEIKEITKRPAPYDRTPFGFFPYTEISPPDHYYEEEYKDKPCQDKAEWKILAGVGNKVFSEKNKPKVIVDNIKVSKVNGEYKVEQEILPKDSDEAIKPMPIGDNIKTNVDQEVKSKEIFAKENVNDEQINLEDIEEGKDVPIGDNVGANDVERKNVPIGDNMKTNEDEQVEPNEILVPKDVNDDVKPKLIGDNVKYHVDGIVAKDTANNEEQVNMKDAMNDVKEDALDANKKETDQKLYAIIYDMKPVLNMRNLYKIADETDQIADQQNVNVKNNVNDSNKIKANKKLENNFALDGKIGKKVEESNQNKPAQETVGKSKTGCRNPMNDIQIKIKLETIDNAKPSLNKKVNSLFDLGRKSLGGFDQFQNMVNKMMPLAQSALNGQVSKL